MPPSSEEIKQVVLYFHPDKASRPNGFPALLFQHFLDVIHKDLIRMISYSLKDICMGCGTNSSFLSLIPKENNPSSFSRFWPVSLCNVSYKIIEKKLALRLKKFISNIINENEGEFFLGRKFSDNVITIQEEIDSSWQRGDQGMIINLDMENAFDRVRHKFMFQVMKEN